MSENVAEVHILWWLMANVVIVESICVGISGPCLDLSCKIWWGKGEGGGEGVFAFDEV